MGQILVMLTGGTIGSKVENSVIQVTENSSYELIEEYKQVYGETDQLEVITPFTMASENATCKHWEMLCNVLKEVDFCKYNGIIITHGTDTLSYIAPIIGMLFGNLPIPIVLVSSNYPLGEENSNGLLNFRSGICFINQQAQNGVFVIYRDLEGTVKVHLSTRVQEADNYLDEFTSYGGTCYGFMIEEQFVLNEYSPALTKNSNLSYRDFFKKEEITLSDDILIIRPYPGMNYNMFSFSNKPKAILHVLYHSATGCTGQQQYDLLKFIENCKNKNIPIYGLGFKQNQNNQYVSTNELLESGMIPIANTSLESAYAKLTIFYAIKDISNATKDIAYQQKVMNSKEFMDNNIYFEILPNLYV